MAHNQRVQTNPILNVPIIFLIISFCIVKYSQAPEIGLAIWHSCLQIETRDETTNASKVKRISIKRVYHVYICMHVHSFIFIYMYWKYFVPGYLSSCCCESCRTRGPMSCWLSVTLLPELCLL